MKNESDFENKDSSVFDGFNPVSTNNDSYSG